ncbi:hypothetical protein D035_0745 [Vibrio parahaemolyticus VP250]|nr:hypothetical protein D035_0745 [Vibrio parahaemolyticus VP250]
MTLCDKCCNIGINGDSQETQTPNKLRLWILIDQETERFSVF